MKENSIEEFWKYIHDFLEIELVAKRCKVPINMIKRSFAKNLLPEECSERIGLLVKEKSLEELKKKAFKEITKYSIYSRAAPPKRNPRLL